MDKLLQDTLESAYWLGFISADGYLSKTNRLVITLSSKDEIHLLKLKNFLGEGSVFRTKNNYSTFQKMDTVVIKKIKEKYGFLDQKTYNPPLKLPFKNVDLLKSFLIGFIDGDGNISNQSKRESYRIQIKVHESWYGFLEELANQTLDSGKMYRVNNNPYCILGIYKNSDIVGLKKFSSDNNLPTLERKWGLIDQSFTVRGDKKQKIRDLLSLGKTPKEIAHQVGCSYGYISSIKSGRVK